MLLKGYILEREPLPAEFKRYEDYYRYLMTNVRNGVDVNGNLNILFSTTYPIAYKKMQNWLNVEPNIDQMTPIIALAFMKSVRTYDPTREDASFIKLYDLFIRREMIDEYFCTVNKERVLKFKYRALDVSLDAPFKNDEGKSENFSNLLPDNKGSDIDVMILKDCIADGIDYIFEQEDREYTRKNKNLKRDREIFRLLLESKMKGEQISQKEWGKRLNLQQSKICRIYQRYIGKLEKYVREC